MLGIKSFRVHPEARSAFSHRLRTVPVEHQPRQNRLLATLPEADYARLLPDLEPVPLLAGQILHYANEHEPHLYFITSGLVVRYCELKNGETTEFALTGCDGVIGIASFLSGESTPFWAEALSAGFAYRLAGRLVAREFAQTSPLARILLRYLHALMVEIGQITVCNRHHSLEERLCRWLLSSQDRLNSAELAVTHELISHVLGVRREGVTQALGSLRNAGLIDQTRGHIILLDRPRLEALVCECYAIVRQEHDARLIPETSCPERAPVCPGTGPVRPKVSSFEP